MAKADTAAPAEVEETRDQKEARLTELYGAPVRLIEYLNREMPVYQPTKEQMAVMARLRGASKAIDVIRDDDKRTDTTVRIVGSIGSTMASFFADQDDWDAIEMALLHKELDYTELPDVFTLVFRAWNDEATAEDDNRAAKRTKRAKRVTG